MNRYLPSAELSSLQRDIAQLRSQLASLSSQNSQRQMSYGGPYRSREGNFGWVQGPSPAILGNYSAASALTLRFYVPDWIMQVLRCNLTFRPYEVEFTGASGVTGLSANETSAPDPADTESVGAGAPTQAGGTSPTDGPNPTESATAGTGSTGSDGTGASGTPSATTIVAAHTHKHQFLNYQSDGAAADTNRHFNARDGTRININTESGIDFDTFDNDASQGVGSSAHTHTGPSHSHALSGSHSHGLASHTHTIGTHTHLLDGTHVHGMSDHTHTFDHDHSIDTPVVGSTPDTITLSIDGIPRTVELGGPWDVATTISLIPYITRGPESAIGAGQGRVIDGFHELTFNAALPGGLELVFDWYVLGRLLDVNT